MTDIDSIALAAAQDIVLMWGQDRSQFVAKIQVRIIEAVAPLLRAPTEQGGRVDEGMSIDLALGYAKAVCTGPMSSQAITVIESALAQAGGKLTRAISSSKE